MIIVVNVPGFGPLTSASANFISDCLVCETDVEIETTLRFSSTTAEYQLITSHSQLVSHDYSSWVSACSGDCVHIYHVTYCSQCLLFNYFFNYFVILLF